MRLDLELSKVDENLLKVSASELEVFDDSATDKVSKVAEDIAKKNAASINVDTLNAVSDLDHLLQGRFLSKQLLRPDQRVLTFSLVFLFKTVEDELSGRDGLSDQSFHARLLVFELLAVLLQLNRVSLSVLGLEIVRRAIDDEAAIDHDGEFVTQLLCFVHSVRSKQDRRHLHLLDHTVERAARYRIHSSGGLVQEEDSRAEHQCLSTAKLTLVTTAQVLRASVLKEV